jgi:hypothetical protein
MVPLPREPHFSAWLFHKKEPLEDRFTRLPRLCVGRKHSIRFKQTFHNRSDFFHRNRLDTEDLSLRHIQMERCYEFLKQVFPLHCHGPSDIIIAPFESRLGPNCCNIAITLIDKRVLNVVACQYQSRESDSPYYGWVPG